MPPRAGNLLQQASWYFLPLGAYVLAFKTIPELFKEASKALLKLLVGSVTDSLEEARSLFARLKKWSQVVFDFDALWEYGGFTDANFRKEGKLDQVRHFVGYMVPYVRIVLWQELAAKNHPTPPIGCSGLDTPWAAGLARGDLNPFTVESNFAHRREGDIVVVMPGSFRDELITKGFEVGTPTKKGTKVKAADIASESEADDEDALAAGASASASQPTAKKARRGAGGGILGSQHRQIADLLRPDQDQEEDQDKAAVTLAEGDGKKKVVKNELESPVSMQDIQKEPLQKMWESMPMPAKKEVQYVEISSSSEASPVKVRAVGVCCFVSPCALSGD